MMWATLTHSRTFEALHNLQEKLFQVRRRHLLTRAMAALVHKARLNLITQSNPTKLEWCTQSGL
jgi:hypothetical protein